MKLVLYLMVALLSFACNRKDATPKEEVLTDSEVIKVKMDVEDLLNRNFQLINKHGYTAELQSLYNSDDFYWVPPQRSLPISYDSVSRILYKFTPGYKSTECVWDTLTIQPLTNEIASYTGRFHSIYTDTAGAVKKFKMMEIGVARRIDGEWKLVAGQTSVSPDQNQ